MIQPFSQGIFSGGMNLFDQDSTLGPTEYGLAYNIRNRTTVLDPVKAATEDTDIPSGKKQGIYAFDRYVIVFVAGRAYYKDVVEGSDWTQIEDFAMNPSVDFIYAEAVPASTLNFVRKLVESGKVDGTDANPAVKVDGIIINGTPACLVCQDGYTQPWIIEADGTARVTQTYNQWTPDSREYVPVMKQMKYHNGILFGVAADGKTIYRSVSGRPLDFVVNVTISGAKGGNAETTSYKVGYDTITSLQSLRTGELLVGTSRTLHLVGLNFTKTIFAEPTFTNNNPIPVGIVNQFSFLSYLRREGYVDYQFIDFDGLRNLIDATDINEGRNSNFSSRISNALVDIKQSTVASILFQDYSLFALATIYGNYVAVYDNKREQWVCFDNAVTSIKQFAVATASNNPTLYCITESKVYSLFTSDDYLTSTIRPKSYNSGTAKAQIRLQDVYCIFRGSGNSGEVTVKELVDDVERDTVTENTSTNAVDLIRFPFLTSTEGWKITPEISWSDGSSLLLIEAFYHTNTNPTPFNQK